MQDDPGVVMHCSHEVMTCCSTPGMLFTRRSRENAARSVHKGLERTCSRDCDILPNTADTCEIETSVSFSFLRWRRRPIGWRPWPILAALLLLAVSGRGVLAGDGFCDPLLCVCGARAANCSFRGFLTVPTGLPPLLLTLGISEFLLDLYCSNLHSVKCSGSARIRNYLFSRVGSSPFSH